MSKEYFDILKAEDIKNRRQPAKNIQCIHDLVCCRYFQIKGNNRRFSAHLNGMNECCMLILNDDGSTLCIAYISKATKNRIKIAVRKYGIEFSELVPFSQLKGYGDKLPYNR